jgi:hypothetical protein
MCPNLLIFILILIGALIIGAYLNSSETYTYGGGGGPSPSRQPLFTNYQLLSRLPYDDPPTGGPDSLGYAEQSLLRKRYPDPSFPILQNPISCPPKGVRIYQTGNADNPNTTSIFGVVGPDGVW